MIKAIIRNLVISFMFSSMLFVSAAWADQKEEAVSLVRKGIAFYKENGESKTMTAITDKGMLQKGELYLWVIQTDFKNKAIVLAHGINRTIPGKEWYNVKDPDGKYFIREICSKAKKDGKGWVEYRWAHPIRKKAMPKVTYFEKIDNIIFLSGYYKLN
jgi:cytochrome c